jgi:hypothetical protein
MLSGTWRFLLFSRIMQRCLQLKVLKSKSGQNPTFALLMKYILHALLILCGLVSRAQLPNDSLEYRIRPDTLKAGDLRLSIYNFNFLRNYEFFNDFQDGYTLFGTQLEPQLVYYPNARLSVSAGIHVRKDFGGKGISRTFPLFSLKYQKGSTALINGVLEGNIQHRFIEPLFDFERKLSNPVEYGTQVVVDKPSLFLNLFLNWNRMIEKGSPEQEQLFAGGTADVAILQNEHVRLSVPGQIFAFHQGGQIDVNPNPLKTVVNTAAGLKFSYHTTGFLKTLKTENYLVSYTDLSPAKRSIFSNGTAIYLNAGIDSRKFGSILGSYWEGRKYISPVGMPIYQSVSQQIDHAGYSEQIRKLLILRYVYQRNLAPNFFLDFRVEPVIDFLAPGSKPVEFFHSLFLVYKQDFRLLSRRSRQ